jgi:hypothetical protein
MVAAVRPRTSWLGHVARAAAVVLAVAGGVAIGLALPDHDATPTVADSGTDVTTATVASNGTGTTLPLSSGYEEAELDDSDFGSTGITLAGYSEDAQSLSLPLQ